MSSTSSRNLTTLYSGAGSVVPQGAYGNANVVSLLAVGTDGGNTVGNITATGNISTTGNVTAAYFIGNIIGNVDAAGANTQVQYNTGNLLDASANLTFNSATDTLSVPNISAISTANLTLTQLGNSDGVTSLNLNANVVVIGNISSGNPDVLIIGALNKNLRLSTNQATGPQPRITLRTTGNIDSQPQPVDTDASVNLFGNVVVGNYFGSSPQPTARGNLMVANDVYVGQSISAAGNVTAANFIGNVTGNITGNVTNALHANVADLANAVAGANVTGTVGLAQYVTQNAQANITSVGTLTSLSVSGNITAANFIGNITGNVTNALHANVADLANAVAGANVSGTVANATYALNANASTYAGTVTTNAQPNITSVGILTAVNTSGAVSATGNITGSYILGNGSQLTGLPATYGNADVAANLAAFANNPISTSGNITAANFFGNVTGNITGNTTNALHANVADLANAVAGANVTGTVANATYATSAGSAATANTVTDAAQANITSVGTLTSLTVTGNVTAANFFGNVTGNITGNTTNALHADVADLANAVAGANVTGTVANATYATSAGHATTANTVTDAAQANITSVGTLTALAVTGAVTAASTSVTGNSTAANVVATGLITSTQQTVAGTANVGTVGNIVIAGRNIATDMILSPDGLTGLANLSRGRIAIGAGNVANSFDYDSNNWRRVLVSDTIYHANTTTRGSEVAVELITSLTGNVNNNSWQNRGLVVQHTVAGGSAANTVAGPVNSAARAVNQVTPIVSFLIVGGNNIGAGNTTVGAGCSMKPGILVDDSSTLTLGYGVQNEIGFNNATGIWNNYVGFASQITAATTPTGNLYAFYHGNANTLLTTGTRVNNTARAAANYYFLRNDDPVAQAQLGSLRSYNEFEYSTATSGTVNIDKTNAQVQMIAPTANVTIGDYQNFMTGISDGTNYDLQSDTVTLIIQQGATPYTVTLPSTANTQIKYSGGSSVVGATANAVTLVSVSAIRNRGNTGNVYLTAVSTEFV